MGWIVYGLLDPLTNELRYVGFTTQDDPRARLAQHRSRAACGATTHVYAWWRKTLRTRGEEPSLLVLDGGDDSYENGQRREREAIAEFRAAGARLTNLTDGGEGASGLTLSDEARAKISAAHRGRRHTPAHVAKQAAALRGKAHPPERRAAIAAGIRSSDVRKRADANKRVLTDQQVADIRATLTGREGEVAALARVLDVSYPTVVRALERDVCGVVGTRIEIDVHDRSARRGPSPATIDRVRAIRERYALGQDLREVAADLGLSLAHVRQVAYRAKFKDVA